MREKKFAENISFEHVTGDRLYIGKVFNRDTQRATYRVSKGGKGGNLKENTLELDCEETMRRLVVDEGYAVRASTKDGKRNGLYKIGAKAIKRMVYDNRY